MGPSWYYSPVMNVLGEKLTDFAGKITSVTATEAGLVVNVENETGTFGNVLYTVTLGPAVIPEEETGAHTIRGQAFSPDGGTLEFSGGGVWRSSGPNQRILKHITQLANGQRTFAVDNFDLVKNTASGTVYALD